MIRSFEESFRTRHRSHAGAHGTGFFQWVDGAPPWGYRAERGPVSEAATTGRPPVVLTGAYGARIIPGLLQEVGLDGVEVLNVENRFFGGNIAVTGLLTAADVGAALAAEPADHRYLLPDVVLSNDRFLDGGVVDDLPRPVEVVPTDGVALVAALRAGVAA
jgi:hypothetical protein